MYSGGSGLSIDIHFVDIELSYDVLSPLPTLLSKHFNHPHPYIEIATAISDWYEVCQTITSETQQLDKLAVFQCIVHVIVQTLKHLSLCSSCKVCLNSICIG